MKYTCGTYILQCTYVRTVHTRFFSMHTMVNHHQLKRNEIASFINYFVVKMPITSEKAMN